MRIYLDNCCFNRPFVDQSQISIHLETQAKLYIQAKTKEGVYDLVWFYILDYENGKNPYKEKRLAIAPWKSIAFFVSRKKLKISFYLQNLLHQKESKPMMPYTLPVL